MPYKLTTMTKRVISILKSKGRTSKCQKCGRRIKLGAKYWFGSGNHTHMKNYHEDCLVWI